MILKELTQTEWELINMIRNYRNAYPNGARMLETEIQSLIDVLMDIEYDEDNENYSEN